MNTYILIFGFANIVAGGPIYYRNKLLYLKKNGWNVNVIPANYGDTYIEDLKPYAAKTKDCIFSYEKPATFSKKQREKILSRMMKFLNIEASNEIIIETGTDYTAYWGELLAKKLKAKHIVFFLDENNIDITLSEKDFFNFKHLRKEFACITPQTMKNFFYGYKEIKDEEAYAIHAICANSVEDYYNSSISYIRKSDINIGYIGRLEKGCVQNIINGVKEFSLKHENSEILFCMIGGSDKEVETRIRNEFNNIKNIHLEITGYIFPIPKSLIDMMDVFTGVSGSAMLAWGYGKPTISFDLNDNLPIGILGFNTRNIFYRETSISYTLDSLLNRILFNKEKLHIFPPENFNKITQEGINNEFDQHMKFIYDSRKEKSYYPIENVKLQYKQIIRKYLRLIMGMRLFDKFYQTFKEIRTNKRR